jgi:CheY-like chemotaxis protein/HPt (histidine-containing phosphotransfer) domain-containing protein
MPDPTPATGRTAIVFAPTGDQDVASLLPALQRAQVAATVATQASQGLGLICRRPAQAPPPSVVIILGGLPGMASAAIAKAVRGLPGMANVPLIVVGESPLGLTRCAMVAHAADITTICKLAAVDPATWPTPGSITSTPVSVSFPAFSAAPAASASGVVLVVDDTATNLMVMRLQAQTCGYPVETCVDGKAAVARVAAGGVALVLMDCQMPEMDGYDATREIRRREAESGGGRHLPIIAVTAHALEENRVRCLEAGMDDFLPKPIHQDTLLARIRHWLPKTITAKPAQTTLPAADDIFDPGPLLRIEQDAPGSSREILAIISKDLLQAQVDLPRLLAADNLDALSRTGHRLKGATGSVGATECAHACADLERTAKAGDLAGSRHACEAIATSINRLTERIQSILIASPKE